jgi:hypothetical protein
VEAARSGAKVLLVEATGMLGGMATISAQLIRTLYAPNCGPPAAFSH